MTGGARDQAGAPRVEVRRSTRRRRTVSAHREGDTVVVLLPARMGAAEERRWVERMLAAVERREAKVRRGDDDLARRAAELSGALLDGRAQATSVAWSPRMGRRWGSCTPLDRTIRISDRLRSAPGYVLDAVLVHELAHLLEAGHGPRFHALADRAPEAERARGWLEGYEAGTSPTAAPSAAGADVSSDEGGNID